MKMTNQVQVIDKPNKSVEVQFYNKAMGLISEVMDHGHGVYLVEFFKLGSRGEYHKLMKSERTNYGSACVIARRYVETGSL